MSPKEGKEFGENVAGNELVNLIEVSMGSTGLQILSELSGNFLFPGSKDNTVELIRGLTILKEEYPTASGKYTFYECRVEGGELRVAIGYRGGMARTTSWTGVRSFVNKDKSMDNWQLLANYCIGLEPEREIQFTGGRNAFTHGRTGITVRTGTWFKIMATGEKFQPIAVFTVHQDGRLIHSTTIPTSSLLFPDAQGNLIPFPEDLPRLEEDKTP